VYETLFAQTNNPLHVWFAIAVANRGAVPLPSWVLTYLGHVAPQMTALVRRVPPRGNALARAVYRALEFDRSRSKNPFTERSEHWHRLNIALAVWYEITDGDGRTKPDFAIDTVQKTHPQTCTKMPPCRRISRTTVARAWREFRTTVSSSSTK
jgi:hypothetical protein